MRSEQIDQMVTSPENKEAIASLCLNIATTMVAQWVQLYDGWFFSVLIFVFFLLVTKKSK